MGAGIIQVGRLALQWLIGSLAGYGSWKVVETAVGPNTIITGGTGDVGAAIAAKTGIPKIFVWLAIVVAAALALRYFFKSK